MTKQAVSLEGQFYRGFACPQEHIDPEFVDLVVVEHARGVWNAFLDKYGALIAEGSDGLVPAIAKWAESEGSFDDVWTLGLGGVRAALRTDMETECVQMATQFGLDLFGRGASGAWTARTSPARRLRWSGWLLPAADELSVSSDGKRGYVIARYNSVESRLDFQRSKDGWESENAEPLPAASLAGRPIPVLDSEALSGSVHNDVRPRLIPNVPSTEIAASLQRATGLLDRKSPDYAAWVSRVLRGVIPLAMVDEMHLSGSHADRPGVVTCSFPTPPEMLCELLVHESTHQYFHILAKLGAIEDGSDTKLYYSPARRMERPLIYVLLAYHAVGNMLLFWRSCLDGPAGFSEDFRHREIELTEWARQLEEPLRLTTGLTDLGRSLWEPLAQRIS